MSRRGAQNFWAYLRWRRHGGRTFCPWPEPTLLPRGDRFGWTAFAQLEDGKTDVSTRHRRCVRAAIEGKRKLNWQIAEWAEGVREGSFNVDEIRSDFPWLPEWVWKAVRRQAFENI